MAWTQDVVPGALDTIIEELTMGKALPILVNSRTVSSLL